MEQVNNPIACEYPIDALKQLHDTKVLSQGHTKDENADEKNIMFHVPCFYKHSMGPNDPDTFLGMATANIIGTWIASHRKTIKNCPKMAEK